MKRFMNRANLLTKWQFTEGFRARAVWIDGSAATRAHIERTRRSGPDGSMRRMI